MKEVSNLSETVDFKIERNPFAATKQSAYMYKKSLITLQRGLTVLVGCNGAGKSTLISDLMYRCRMDGLEYINYDNLTNGGNHTLDLMINMGQGNVNDIGRYWTSSEGERIHINIENLIRKIISTSRKLESGSNLFIFGDAIDSGSSIDHIADIVEVFKLIVEDMKTKNNIDVYFIISANSYEMARHNKCFEVQTGEYIEFTDYEDYRKFILKSRDKKDKRDYNYVEKVRKRDQTGFERKKSKSTSSSEPKPKHRINMSKEDEDEEERFDEQRNKWKDVHHTRNLDLLERREDNS